MMDYGDGTSTVFIGESIIMLIIISALVWVGLHLHVTHNKPYKVVKERVLNNVSYEKVDGLCYAIDTDHYYNFANVPCMAIPVDKRP